MIHFIFIYSVIQFISILFFETETVILNDSGLTIEKDHIIQMPLRKQYTKPYTTFSPTGAANFKALVEATNFKALAEATNSKQPKQAEFQNILYEFLHNGNFNIATNINRQIKIQRVQASAGVFSMSRWASRTYLHFHPCHFQFQSFYLDFQLCQ